MEKSLEGLGSRIPNLKHSTLSNISLDKKLLTKNKSHNRVITNLNNNNYVHNSNKNIFSYYKVKNSFLRPDINKTFNFDKKNNERKNFNFSFNNNNNNNFININNIFLNNISEVSPFNSPRINTYSNPNRNNINYIYKELKEDEEIIKKIKEKKKFHNKLKPNINNKNFLIKEYIKCMSPFKNFNDNFNKYQNGFKSNKKNKNSKNLFNKTTGKFFNRNNFNNNNNLNLILNSINSKSGFFDNNNNNKRNIINKRFPKNEIEKFSNGFLTSSYIK